MLIACATRVCFCYFGDGKSSDAMARIHPLFQIRIPQPPTRYWSSAIWVVLLLLASLRVQAMCGFADMSFWPSASVIPRNPVFVIEGDPHDGRFLKSLGSQSNVELRSGKQTVCLDVHAILGDGAGLTQVLLHPDAILDSGKRYQLWIEGYAKHKRGNNPLIGPLPVPPLPFWKAGDFSHQKRPSWQKKPKVVKRFRSISVCPSSNYVTFQGKVASEREYLVRAHLRPKGMKSYWTAYIHPESEGNYHVGSVGCGGVFSISGWPALEVKFDLMDVAGNVVPWSGKPMVFEPADKAELSLF